MSITYVHRPYSLNLTFGVCNYYYGAYWGNDAIAKQNYLLKVCSILGALLSAVFSSESHLTYKGKKCCIPDCKREFYKGCGTPFYMFHKDNE